MTYENEKIVVEDDNWNCHHCNAPIKKHFHRYVYGSNSYCQKCHIQIDELIAKIADYPK